MAVTVHMQILYKILSKTFKSSARQTFQNPHFSNTLARLTAEFCVEKGQMIIQKVKIYLFLNSTKMKAKKNQTTSNL